MPSSTKNDRPTLCPHCGSLALVSHSPTLRFVCGVCGKARVPVEDPALAQTVCNTTAANALTRATTARNAAFLWRALAIAAVVLAFLAYNVVALVAVVSHLALLTLLIAIGIASLPLVLAFYGFQRTRSHRKQTTLELDSAWESVAHEVAQARGVIDGAQLAALLCTTPTHAEQLLLHLSATTDLSSRITDEGAIEFYASGYSLAPLEQSHLRAPPAQTPPADQERPSLQNVAHEVEAENRSLSAPQKETGS